MIEEINNFIEKMNTTNSQNNKVDIIRHASREIRKLLFYTYNPFMQFNIKPKNLEKNKDLYNKDTRFENIYELLNSLNERKITGNKAISEVNGFLFNNKEYKDIFYMVLNRNLKLRVSINLINKACPGLIPQFNVALANKYDDNSKKKIDFQKDIWYVSRKLDGVRCIIIIDDKGEAKSFSRSGKQFHTLKLIEEEIKSLGVKNIVYDGEMCIVDEEGNEDFQDIIKEIGRKDHTIKNGLYQIFDYIPYRIFSKGYGDVGTFSQRIFALQSLILGEKLKYIDYLEQIPISNFEELELLTEKASEKGWEGLMLRKNCLYKGKRSNDILKVKTFHDNEYIVKDVFYGPIRYIKEGKEVEEEMLSGISIEHKGNIVRVGSGFSLEQRKKIYKDSSLIIGKTITVQYFEETKNKLGEYSLRFPTIKVIHGNKREF